MSNRVPAGWEAASFGDLCKFSGGSAFKEKYQGKGSGDYPFIKVSDMNIEGNQRFITKANHWIDQVTRLEAKVKLFPEPAVVFAKVGAALLLNRRRILTRETAIDNNMMAAIPFEDGHNFLYYALQDVDLGEIVQGGAVPSVNQAQMEDIPVLIPPLPEQQKIATILSSVDDVIEKTRAQIDKLKDLKTGMMQELLTKGIGHTEFKDSPVGRIPAEWQCEKIGALFEVQLGKMLSKAAKVGNSSFPYLGNKNVQWGRVDINDLEEMNFSDSERQKFSLECGDLLVCEGGDAGRSAIWEGELEKCYYQKAIHRLRPINEAYEPRLLLEYMKYAKTVNLLVNFISQTSIAHLTRTSLISIQIPVPPLAEQKQIVDICSSVDSRIYATENKLTNIKKIKKALMQDLLTGKVRVE